jgi:cell division protein ZapA
MSQSIVTIRLNGTPYQIGCGAGEEPRIEELAAEIESVVQQLVGSVGQIGEARLLAMTALIFADRAQETAGKASAPAADGSPDGVGGDDASRDDAAAAALDRAAERILALASNLSSH